MSAPWVPARAAAQAEVLRSAETNELPDRVEPTPAMLAETCARHDVEIVRPPIA